MVKKTAMTDVTFALAKLPHGPRNRRRRGQVTVVGIGSGTVGQLTPEVYDALCRCTTIAGYGPYLDCVSAELQGKQIIRNGMRGEVQRCTDALEAACAGEDVCMVCSGDPGILAMAGLLFELRVDRTQFSGIPIRVLPGITAASLAAAALGAPLQNGFSLISLSDLLVPTDEVRRNIQAAAQTALPVVLYNPAGRKRRTLLHEAVALFTGVRGENQLCAFVRHAGRPQEERWIGTLGTLPLEQIDMSSLLLIGGSRTVRDGDVLFERRGYAEKYGDRA